MARGPAFNEDAVIITSGKSFTVQGQNGRRFGPLPYKQSDITIVPRGVATQWRFESSVSFENIVVSPSSLLISAIGEEAFKAGMNQVELIDHVAEADLLLHHIGLALLEEMRSGDAANRLYVESLTQTFTLHLLTKHATIARDLRDVQGKLPRRLLHIVFDFIDNHLDSDLSLTQIAACVHISPFHFARLFKLATGLTVHQYVTERRITKGKRLLEQGQMTIGEVAREVGFSDQSHFTRHFKVRYGITPGQVPRKRTILQGPGK